MYQVVWQRFGAKKAVILLWCLLGRGGEGSPSCDQEKPTHQAIPHPTQVQKLLEAMGLKQYLGNFKEEQVNGEILSECDEEVLQNDLGVASKLHRMRLLKVISGRHSARYILAGDDPYAHRRKASGSSC